METTVRSRSGLTITRYRRAPRLSAGQRLFVIVGTVMAFALIAAGLMF